MIDPVIEHLNEHHSQGLGVVIVVAVVDPAKCTGCLTCVRICPYGVPRINPAQVAIGGIMGAAHIEAAACHGCGSCASECPGKAIQLMHYKDGQVLAKVEALFAAPIKTGLMCSCSAVIF